MPADFANSAAKSGGRIPSFPKISSACLFVCGVGREELMIIISAMSMHASIASCRYLSAKSSGFFGMVRGLRRGLG